MCLNNSLNKIILYNNISTYLLNCQVDKHILMFSTKGYSKIEVDIVQYYEN